MNIKNQFKLISTEAEVRELISYCKTTRYASIDFETSNFKFYEGKEYPTILGCSFQIGFTYIILLGHFESPNKDNYIPLLQIFFKEVIEDPEIVKIAWNIAYEHKWIKRYGYSLRGRCFDAMLAKYLLNEERPNDLKSQVSNYLPSWSKYETELPEDGDWSKIPLEKLAPYNAIDCDAALRLFIFFESKLIKHKFYRTFRNLIMPTRLRVLDEMEFKGMCINRKYLEKTTIEQAERIKLNEDDLRRHPRLIKFSKYRERAHIKKLIDAVQKEIEEIQDDEDRKNKDKLIKARELKVQNYIQGKLTTKKELLEEFNFNSPDQLGQFLFTKKGMNLPIIEYTKSGAPSTAEAALIELKQYDKSSFIEQLLNHRGMVALYNTFLKGMLERLSTKDKVHASFLIHGCVTEDTILIGQHGDFRIGEIVLHDKGVRDISKMGLKVLTHKGTFELVTHSVNKGLLETWEIEDIKGNKLKCTPKHKLLTPNGWKTVKYILKHNITVISWDTTYLSNVKPPITIKPEQEEIKPIKDFPNYFVSNWGFIYTSKIKGAQGKSIGPLTKMVGRRSKHGYLYVGLRINDGKRYKRKVSLLVAEAFIGVIPEGYVVDHINCNKSEDYSTNLQIITHSENTKRAYANNRNSFTKGDKNGATRLGIKEVGSILDTYLNNKKSKQELREKYNLGQSSLDRILRGDCWSNIYIGKLKLIKVLEPQLILDITVQNKHSYITNTNFINKNTVTGRLSSKGPNLQNIPRVTTSDLIKPMFVPPKGFLLLEVDYSQAELRVVAEIANETNMIEIFRRGYNIHLATACKANKVLDRYSEMKAIYDDPNHKDNLFWIKQHKRAKLINFGILYGQTKYKLAIELGCSHDEAQIFIDEWFEMYPAIGKWIKKQHRQAKREGYVMSLWGRKRRLPLAMFENEREAKQANQFGQWLEALRQSVNAPIQGIASDFTLFSSLIIREEQLKGNLPMSMRQCYTVHDSLGFYIEPKDIHKAVPKIVEICNNPQTERYFGFQLTQVKMKVSPEIGKNWGNLTDYNPWQNYKKWLN